MLIVNYLIVLKRKIKNTKNSDDIHLGHLYSFILVDIFETKLYASRTITIREKSPLKYTLPINLDRKAVEPIWISQILNHPDLTETVPCGVGKKNIPMVTYQLDNTDRNKLLNYKENVNSIFVDGITFS